MTRTWHAVAAVAVGCWAIGVLHQGGSWSFGRDLFGRHPEFHCAGLGSSLRKIQATNREVMRSP